LGSVSTFAFFQFAQRCGPASLAISIVEFILILSTLLIVSILITRVAQRENGLDALFSKDTEDSKYSHRWGSLYMKLKREMYWFFIPEYAWVLSRSAVVAFGQVCVTVKPLPFKLFNR
jgi:hypothetical protein